MLEVVELTVLDVVVHPEPVDRVELDDELELVVVLVEVVVEYDSGAKIPKTKGALLIGPVYPKALVIAASSTLRL